LNKGGVNSDGKKLVDTLPVGELQISKEMMDEERQLINDAFLVSLFQILTETPQMTATEVIERTNEKGILIAPSMGRQGSEYLGTMIPRELDLMQQMGMLEPMPPKLEGSLQRRPGQFAYPLHLAAVSRDGSAGGRRLHSRVETTKEIVAITQDQSLLDVYELDIARPAMARIQGTPEPWLASPEHRAEAWSARQGAREATANSGRPRSRRAHEGAGRRWRHPAVGADGAPAAPGQQPCNGRRPRMATRL
jgi:hypothetical protein